MGWVPGKRGWLGRFRGFVEVKRSWSGGALGLGDVGLEFGDVLAGDERGLARIDPPAFGEAADIHRVEAEFVVEPATSSLATGSSPARASARRRGSPSG